MSELLLCPFCGGEAVKLTSIDGFTSIGCLNCNPFYGVMIQATTEAEAIAAWNSRAERTCKIESSYYYDDYDLYEFEFSCGHSVNMYDKEPTNYCPICGCKVVSE